MVQRFDQTSPLQAPGNPGAVAYVTPAGTNPNPPKDTPQMYAQPPQMPQQIPTAYPSAYAEPQPVHYAQMPGQPGAQQYTMATIPQYGSQVLYMQPQQGITTVIMPEHPDRAREEAGTIFAAICLGVGLIFPIMWLVGAFTPLCYPRSTRVNTLAAVNGGLFVILIVIIIALVASV